MVFAAKRQQELSLVVGVRSCDRASYMAELKGLLTPGSAI